MANEAPAGTPQVLVILKPKADSLKAAEGFLKNRNWQLISTPNLREALAGILQKQPKFVLLAADHPNRKVRTLPRLLAQAFPCRAIAFIESSQNSAMSALHEMGMEYNLYPPVSGPAIERMINKIIKDDETRKANPDSNRLASSSGPGQQTIAGDGTQVISSDNQQAFEQARNALKQFMASAELSEGDGNILQPSGADTGNSGVIIQKGTQAKTMSSQQDPTLAQESVNPALAQAINPTEALNPEETQTSLANEFASDWSRPESNAHDALQGVAGSAWQKNQGSKQAKREKQSMGPASQDPEHAPQDPLNLSLMQKATEAVLQEIATPLTTEQVGKISLTSNVACLLIESTHFSGYLLAAIGQNRIIDEQLMSLLQAKLYAFLKNHGSFPRSESEKPLNLKIREVELEKFVLEHAEFFRKALRGADEIALAFFPTEDFNLNVADSLHEKMIQIPVQELRDDLALEFDLYIFMPENNKFLLYTPQGRPLYKDQKARLLNKGVTHMHLRKEDLNEVRRYQAQIFLNDQIELYYAKKKA